MATELSEIEINQVKELSKQPNIYERLVFNVAPSLYGMNLEKEAALLSLVGGVKKEGKEINFRECIHVLYVGDPSMGKSQLLWAVHDLAPLGLYSSAKGISAAGLTAAVIKDEDKDFIIAAGVMVLADKGIACIDELDKMKPEDREAMNSAMEQQIVMVDKANIHTTLQSRTTVLSAANPILGRYDPNKTIGDNIKNLPTVLLTRFDLIFILLDIPNDERDIKLVKHIFEIDESQLIDRALLKNYIIVAKSYKPKMTPEAEAEISKFYLQSRKLQNPEDPIPITPRYFLALIRLAEAHSKLLFKDKVDISDAQASVRILEASLRQTCKFKSEGSNINMLEAPSTTSKAGKESIMLNTLNSEGPLEAEIWKEKVKKFGIDSEFNEILLKLINARKIYEPESGLYQISGKGFKMRDDRR